MNLNTINKVRKGIVYCLMLLIWGCSFEPEPISYGKDACSFCKMSIMEDRYACEVVTDKGKVLKFDDLTCLTGYLNEAGRDRKQMARVLVNNFSHPHDFLDVDLAFFASGKPFNGPMNGNVAAFRTSEEAIQAKEEHPEVVLLSWENVVKHFHK